MPVKPRILLAPPPAFSDHIAPAINPHTVRTPPRASPPAANAKPPAPPQCGDAVSVPGRDLICTLPPGHGGGHAHVLDVNAPRNRERAEARAKSRT